MDNYMFRPVLAITHTTGMTHFLDVSVEIWCYKCEILGFHSCGWWRSECCGITSNLFMSVWQTKTTCFIACLVLSERFELDYGMFCFFLKKRLLPKICSACCLTFESPAVSLRTARFNIKKFNMVLALLWVFCTDLRTESDFCFVHHWLTGFYSRGGKCLLRGTDWFLIYSRLRFVFERFSSSAYSYLNNILVLLVRAALNCHSIFFWNFLSFDDKICTGIPPPVPSRIQQTLFQMNCGQISVQCGTS